MIFLFHLFDCSLQLHKCAFTTGCRAYTYTSWSSEEQSKQSEESCRCQSYLHQQLLPQIYHCSRIEAVEIVGHFIGLKSLHCIRLAPLWGFYVDVGLVIDCELCTVCILLPLLTLCSCVGSNLGRQGQYSITCRLSYRSWKMLDKFVLKAIKEIKAHESHCKTT